MGFHYHAVPGQFLRYLRAEYEAKLKENGVENRMDPAWYVKPADADSKKTVV